ncbi:MAG: hypothetical protein RIE08_08060 [Acidimicrobiales bacterium]
MSVPALVGVVPAAGRATRLGAIPCSKEILPVAGAAPSGVAVRVACHSLLESMALAGVRRCLVVVDVSKCDVVEFLGDGGPLGMDLAFLAVRDSPDTPTTVDRARGHVGDATVVFGFPDIQIEPVDALARVTRRRQTGGADIVLGVLPATDVTRVDMVTLDGERVVSILPKPAETDLTLTWLLAAWGPTFTEFLHIQVSRGLDGRGEVFIGDIVQSAIDTGLVVEAEVIADGRYRDVGTPEDLAAAQRADLLGQPGPVARGPRPTARTRF